MRFRITFLAVQLFLESLMGCDEISEDETSIALDDLDPIIASVAGAKYFGCNFRGASLPFSLFKIESDTYTGRDVGSGYSCEHNTPEGFSFIHIIGIGWFADQFFFEEIVRVSQLAGF